MQGEPSRLEKIESLVESNARTIQAMLEMMATERLDHEESNQRLSDAIRRLTDLNEGVVNLLSHIDEDRPTILRKLSAIENKVDRLIDQTT